TLRQANCRWTIGWSFCAAGATPTMQELHQLRSTVDCCGILLPMQRWLMLMSLFPGTWLPWPMSSRPSTISSVSRRALAAASTLLSASLMTLPASWCTQI
ncbi:hypothetical protein IWW56_006572, partial [Coemansia sp. RSA 2131]